MLVGTLSATLICMTTATVISLSTSLPWTVTARVEMGGDCDDLGRGYATGWELSYKTAECAALGLTLDLADGTDEALGELSEALGLGGWDARDGYVGLDRVVKPALLDAKGEELYAASEGL